MNIKQLVLPALLPLMALSADTVSFTQTLQFSIEAMNDFGPIKGPAPVFHVTHRKKKGATVMTVKNNYDICVEEAANMKIIGFLDVSLTD